MPSCPSYRCLVIAALLAILAFGPLGEGADSFDPDLQDNSSPASGSAKTKNAPTKTQSRRTTKRNTRRNTSGKRPEVTPEMINEMVEYYLKLYGKFLRSPDWVGRAMAVVSLARIDDPRVTDKLLTVLENDKRTVVRAFACEAMHARTRSLTDEQRRRWLGASWKLIDRGALRGDLRLGPAGALSSAPPTPATRKAFAKIFDNTNMLQIQERAVITALRTAMGAWRDRKTAAALIQQMGDINNAYRAEYVLTGLASGVPPASRQLRKGTRVMWAEAQEAWQNWLDNADLKPAKASDLTPYRHLSRLLPPAEKILDTMAAKWRADLELPPPRPKHFDVTFVIDSTGSMEKTITWLKRDVTKIMQAFGMIALEPRIGVVFYRDHGDAYVTQVHPLTGDGTALSRSITSAFAKGGGKGDVPEAVYEGLQAALTKQRWTKGDYARRVVVLIGDAPPHANTIDKIEKLVTDHAAKGFRFFCVKARTNYGKPDMSSFDKIASWGEGRSFSVNFSASSVYRYYRSLGRTPSRTAHASPDLIITEVLKTILHKGYHDRSQSFVNVLIEYLETPVPERRGHRGPYVPRPPRTTPPRNNTPRPPPRDPQER